jgi:hypothetical protein
MPSRFPIYERLLCLYPRRYREQYGHQMLQTLGDMLDDAQGTKARFRVWSKTITDMPVSAAQAQLQYSRAAVPSEAPRYIQRGSLLATLLVAPFFVALIANAADKVLNGQTLYNTWLWRMPALSVWVLWLPLAALVVALRAYLLHTCRLAASGPGTWVYRMFDVKRAWPVMLPGIAAMGTLFILLFHDSAHCWVQNPIWFVTRLHQTWQCTSNGFLGGR